jgi:hypothetical protein
MPVYAFELRDGSKVVNDDTGTDLPDRETIRAKSLGRILD